MFEIGDILFDRYQLQQRLGKTGVGHQTWLANDLQSPIFDDSEGWKNWSWLRWIRKLASFLRTKFYQKVTIKLLAFSPQMEWEQFKLFEREAQVLQSLNHPQIPRYQNYFEIPKEAGDGVPWFALVEDYIPGKSLQEVLDKGERLSEKRIRLIATEILTILIYLHELSPPVLHRDIKPSNLILGEDGHIYLIDFGAVQAQAAITNVTFTIVGTIGYTPLEQFWGRAVPASDLYALGATLIHLLTGIAPADLQTKDYQFKFEDQVNIRPSFEKWLKKLTEIILENRYQTAKEALDSLKYFNSIQEDFLTVNQSRNKLKFPEKSCVKLEKSEAYLEIFLPAPPLRLFKQFFRKSDLLAGFKQDSWLIFSVVSYGLFLVPFVLTIAGIILEIPPLIVASLEIMGGMSCLLFLILMIAYIVSLIGTNTYLHFDQDNLSIKEKILGIEYHQEQEDYKNIVGIFIHEILDQYQISINTRKMIYFLGNKLSRDEALWLVKEIQDWLLMGKDYV